MTEPGSRGTASRGNGGTGTAGRGGATSNSGSGTGGSGSGGPPGGTSRGGADGAAGGAFDAPLIGRRSDDADKPGQRRWGYYSKRASIGFERSVTVYVRDESLKLPSGRTVAVGDGDEAADVAANLADAIEQEARSWGKPPDSFYWVPSIRFVGAPETHPALQQLQSPLQKAGLPSRIERTRK
jgi:hypothetical protein